MDCKWPSSFFPIFIHMKSYKLWLLEEMNPYLRSHSFSCCSRKRASFLFDISHFYDFLSTLQKSWNNCQHLQRGRHYRALYPCHVCTLAWPPHCCWGQKVPLWCVKWFTHREDANKVFIQEPGQEVPSDFKRPLWTNNSPRSISLLSFYFLSLQELSGTNGSTGM